MTLWEHQERAVEGARDEIRRGARAPLIVCPMGGGKTRIAVEICSGAVARGNRVLWLAHRRELVDQAAADLRKNGATDLGFIRAGFAEHPQRPIQVASIQTLLARGERSLPPAQIVVLDECHHYLSRDWNAIAKHYDNVIRVGLTATPQRSDGTALGNLFDVLINVASVRELTEAGFLVPCNVIRPDQRQGARTIAQDPVTAYREYAPRSQAIVFCTDVAEAKTCAERFKSIGVPAACVDGKMAATERDLAIERFKAGRIRVLTNCFVLTEGFNHPAVETCILARGCGVVSTYLQMVGRVLRASAGKKSALLIDLTGAVIKHGLPDDDREWTLDGNGCRKGNATPVVQCKLHGFAFRPGHGCPACNENPGCAPPPVRISGDRLVAVDRDAAHSDVEKEAFYLSLRRECVARGYKLGWVHHRFTAKFGEPYRARRDEMQASAPSTSRLLGITGRSSVSDATVDALTRVSRTIRARECAAALLETVMSQPASEGGIA